MWQWPLGRAKATRRDILVVFNSTTGSGWNRTGLGRTVRTKKVKGARCTNHWAIPDETFGHGEASLWCCIHVKQLFWEATSLAPALRCPRPGRVLLPPMDTAPPSQGLRDRQNNVACANMPRGGPRRAVNGYKTCQSLISYSQKRDFHFLAESFCLERSQAPASWESALAVQSAKGCSMAWQGLFLIFFNNILLYDGIFFFQG